MILGAILILAGTIYGYAQSPAVFGHDVSEIDGIPECAANQYLTFIDGTFSCESDQIGGGESEGLNQDSCRWSEWSYSVEGAIGNEVKCDIGEYTAGIQVDDLDDGGYCTNCISQVRNYCCDAGAIISGASQDVQACRTCFKAAGSGNWGDWQCTDYAYPGEGMQESPVVHGGDTGQGWTFRIKMECI